VHIEIPFERYRRLELFQCHMVQSRPGNGLGIVEISRIDENDARLVDR
jgi:hypothetical protein